MRLLPLLGLLLITLGALRAQSPAPAPTRPNLVVFLVDDLGFCDTEVPMQGEPNALHRRWHTPNVARLARAGMKFAHAYASAPVCSPTRTALLTGQSPARTHITYWLLGKDQDTSAPHPRLLPPAWNVHGLTARDTTLPGLLRTAGYRTIHVGKAHFGAVGTDGADPRNLGFDVNVAGHGAGAPGSYLGRHGFREAGRTGRPASQPSVWDVPGLEQYHGQDVWLDEALAREAVAELRRAAADHVPFFLHFAPYGVHAPIMPNPRHAGHYADLDATEAAYGTMIESVDAALGAVLDELDRLDIAGQTLVVFTSDNGGLSAHARGRAPDGQLQHTHNQPLRSGKGSAYEGGIRVPLVVRWPGVVPPATSNAAPVISHDWFPTLLAAAQVRAPEVDGRDLMPLLRDPAASPGPRLLSWHQPHYWGIAGPGIAPFTAVRRGDHKLVWFHGDRFELFDLGRDLGERQDLIHEQPARAAELVAAMDAWLRETGAHASIDKATGQPLPGPVAAFAAWQATASRPASRSGSVRWLDLARDQGRQVVVDREDGQYLGHVTTVLLEDRSTLLAVYPKGHGRGAIVMKRSTDGGRTWSERLPVPGSWAKSQEVPTLHRVVDAAGKKRLILWSGLHPARLAVSEDDVHWSELRDAGNWGGIVVMGSVLGLATPGHYAAWFHDDGRFLAAGGKASGVFTLLQTVSTDGGLSWSAPAPLFRSGDVHLCEPGAIRSDDGHQIALLLRENARRKRSHVMFSGDEARTWSTPRELPLTLTGDRHTAVRAPDGRLVVTFRDRTPGKVPDGNADLDKLGQGSPTEGDWVAWVGRYDDLVHGRDGQYRVRLMDNTRGWDCAYPGLEVLADGTLVATTYGHWDAGQPPYIVCVRFRLDELDALARR